MGVVDLVDCVVKSRSKWWDGESFAWVLAHPRPLVNPIPWKGRLSLFNIPDAILKNLSCQKGRGKKKSAFRPIGGRSGAGARGHL
ncbi:MAG: hypothetical protein LBE84_00595 [Planctomycetota bacterium]|nr:hypothetical protein [Planctomycetota bacterium]